MGNYKVEGEIKSDHKFLTVTEFLHTGNKLIQGWYWNPAEFVQNLVGDGEDVKVTTVQINRDIPSNDKCWSCGVPVEAGEKFCNEDCKSAHYLKMSTNEE